MAKDAKKPTVFISYCHADRQFVNQFADRLRASGVNVWVDKWMIKVGDSITDRINEGIGASDWLILILSRASVKSKWVRQEMNAAMIRNIEQGKHAFLLPALIEECDIPQLLRDRKYANFKDDPELAFQELLEVIRPEVTYTPLFDFEPELIHIPAGEFLMGSDPKKDKDAWDNEQPQHRLSLPDYYMAKTPVTNAQYLAFLEDMGHAKPRHWEGGKPPGGKEEHPVVHVTWQDAMAHCRWLAEATGKGYRLPSEAEWEKAARGGLRIGSEDNPCPDRVYPWGDEWDQSLCNSREGGPGNTTPVGRYSPGGDSAYGCVDMAGNVWERTLSVYKGYPYHAKDGREYPEASGSRAERGGSWLRERRYARVSSRVISRLSDLESHDVGFRVCVAAQ